MASSRLSKPLGDLDLQVCHAFFKLVCDDSGNNVVWIWFSSVSLRENVAIALANLVIASFPTSASHTLLLSDGASDLLVVNSGG